MAQRQSCPRAANGRGGHALQHNALERIEATLHRPAPSAQRPNAEMREDTGLTSCSGTALPFPNPHLALASGGSGRRGPAPQTPERPGTWLPQRNLAAHSSVVPTHNILRKYVARSTLV